MPSLIAFVITPSEATLTRVTLGLYGLLLIVGGVMGYLKAGSRPSLIAGSASGVVALVALALSVQSLLGAILLGFFLALAMLVVFWYRLVRTRKFMPSGLLLVASLAVLFVLILVMANASPRAA